MEHYISNSQTLFKLFSNFRWDLIRSHCKRQESSLMKRTETLTVVYSSIQVQGERSSFIKVRCAHYLQAEYRRTQTAVWSKGTRTHFSDWVIKPWRSSIWGVFGAHLLTLAATQRWKALKHTQNWTRMKRLRHQAPALSAQLQKRRQKAFHLYILMD